MLALALDSDLF